MGPLKRPQRSPRSPQPRINMRLFGLRLVYRVLFGLLLAALVLLMLWVINMAISDKRIALTGAWLAFFLGLACFLLDMMLFVYWSVTAQFLITSPVGIEYITASYIVRTSWNNLLARKNALFWGPGVQLQRAALDRATSFRMSQSLMPWLNVLAALSGRQLHAAAVDEDELQRSIPLGKFDRRWADGATPLGAAVRQYAPQLFGGALPAGPAPAPDTFPPTLAPYIVQRDWRWLWGLLLLGQICLVAGLAWWWNGGLALKSTLSVDLYTIDNVQFADDGRTLHVIGGELQTWTLPQGQLLGKTGDIPPLSEAALSADGTLLAEGSAYGAASLWQIAGDKATLLHELMPARDDTLAPFVTSIAVAPDNETVATGLENGTLKLWSTRDGQVTKILQDNGEDAKIQPSLLSGYSSLDDRRVEDLTFAPSGDWLAFHDQAAGLKLCPLPAGTCTAITPDHYGANYLKFAPDGKTLAVATYDGTVNLYRSGDGSLMGTFESSGARVDSLAFTSDGAWLAVGASNGTIDLVRMRDLTAAKQLRGHGDTISALAFAPDNRTLASGSGDRTVRIWDTSELGQGGR